MFRSSWHFALKFVVVSVIATSSQYAATAAVTRARYLMGTTCVVSAPTAADDDAAFAEIARVEQLISTWRDDSELSQLNRAPLGSVTTVSPELAMLLQNGSDLSRQSGRAFHPLVRPLIDAWKTRQEGAAPTGAVIAHALARMELDDLQIDVAHSTVIRRSDVQVEEGGFGKGYALDRAVAMLQQRGAPAATLDIGGQLAVFGVPVQVSIAAPDDRQHAVITFQLHDASLSTSSGSEKQFDVGGRHVSHIFDPRNGQALPPAGSVSVIDRNAFRADALSTALYVLGAVEGLAWANQHEVAAIFIMPESSAPGWSVVLSRSAMEAASGLRAVSPHIIIKGLH